MKLFKIITFMLLIAPNYSYAQGHSGVGGGDASASDLQSYINRIDSYLLSNDGRNAFPEIKQPEFHDILVQVKPVVKDERVYDSFGIAQTCISHVEIGNRFFQCDLQRLPKIELNNQPTFYHLAFHELLFQGGLELPANASVPSNFEISSRLQLRLQNVEAWVPGTASMANDEDAPPHCKVWFRDEGHFFRTVHSYPIFNMTECGDKAQRIKKHYSRSSVSYSVGDQIGYVSTGEAM